MKISKNIAKAMAISLLFNNISILSNATAYTNDMPSRYQTLEGEHVLIEDSARGYLHEIEIFGNTVQGENNLEDVQSVGDLYVDENGNPILDNQGREQYKIDIISTNGLNLLDMSKGYEVGGLTVDGELSTTNEFTSSDRTFNHYIPVKEGDIISLYPYVKKTNGAVGSKWGEISGFDSNKRFVKRLCRGYEEKRTEIPNGISYIRVGLRSGPNAVVLPFDIYDDEEGYNNGIYVSPIYGDYKTEEHKTTILIPTQLQKVGDVYDRLYWDTEKGRYVIEKNIGEVPIDFFKDKVFKKNAVTEYRCLIWNVWNKFDTGGVADRKINTYTRYNIFKCSDHGLNTIYVYYNINNLNSLGYYDESNETLYNAFFQDVIKIYFVLKNSSVIETNMTSKLKIPTYEDKTYIYVETENGVNPTLKVTADKINKVSQEAVDIVEQEPTIHNISLARSFVNQMKEGELKEQLQQRLNEISNFNGLQLDRKTATANLDVYIKSENMLLMSLNTNQITFDDFSGVNDILKDDALEISINSSLPYNLNAYLTTEIQNSDKSQTMDKEIFQLKDDNEVDYQYFNNINEKMTLKNNCEAGNDKVHLIDFKLKGGIAHEKDIYKTVVKFEAEQI